MGFLLYCRNAIDNAIGNSEIPDKEYDEQYDEIHELIWNKLEKWIDKGLVAIDFDLGAETATVIPVK